MYTIDLKTAKDQNLKKILDIFDKLSSPLGTMLHMIPHKDYHDNGRVEEGLNSIRKAIHQARVENGEIKEATEEEYYFSQGRDIKKEREDRKRQEIAEKELELNRLKSEV